MGCYDRELSQLFGLMADVAIAERSWDEPTEQQTSFRHGAVD